ncbi:MAG TPA: sulfite exporter TauE/SafE family protein [Stellaceae bacterium]|nr:sulfite exporter TauE/SafE family protein [Stellaceae bacterium]
MILHAILGLPPLALAALFAVFVFGGIVKGVTGVGLPLVLVPLAAQFIDIPVAVALVIGAQVATNVTQAAEGGHTLAAIRANWPVLIMLVAGTLIGVHVLISIDRHRLDLILGAGFLVLAAMLLFLRRVRIGERAARWAGPAVGFTAGVLGGMSAMFGPPLIAYLLGRGTDPNSFVKQMAIFALTASATMLLALGGSGTMALADFLISAGAIIPIGLGMPLGRWLRRRINPDMFRLAVLAILAVSGLDLLRKALY